MTVYGPDIEII